MTNWNRAHIERLKEQGKIRDFNIPVISHPSPAGRIVAKHFEKKSKGLDYIGWNLLYWCNERSLQLMEEYVFDETRKWRFDWAIPSIKLAVEFEGGVYQAQSGHNTAKHYTKDTNKYNAAAMLGWKVLRFTAMNYKDLLAEVNKFFNQ